MSNTTDWGRGWLDLLMGGMGMRRCRRDPERLRQAATLDALRLWGMVSWYGVRPLHQLVFAGMLRGLSKSAEERK